MGHSFAHAIQIACCLGKIDPLPAFDRHQNAVAGVLKKMKKIRSKPSLRPARRRYELYETENT